MHDCYEYLAASTCSVDQCHWLRLWHLHVSGLGVSCHTSKGWKNPPLGRMQSSLNDLPDTVSKLCNASRHWQIQFLSGQARMHSTLLGSVRSTVRRKLILGFGMLKTQQIVFTQNCEAPSLCLGCFLGTGCVVISSAIAFCVILMLVLPFSHWFGRSSHYSLTS